MMRNCTRCGGEYAILRPRAQTDGLCPKCHRNERTRRNYQRRVEQGLRGRCGRPALPDKNTCAECAKEPRGKRRRAT